jgi:nicotinamidase-related amidase
MIDRHTRPDFAAMALVTIDVQKDFLDSGVCEVPGTTDILPRIADLLTRFRQLGRPIVHAVRLYVADGSNADLCRRTIIESDLAIVRPGTAGAALADQLLPPGTLGLDSFALDSDRLLNGRLQPVGPHEWIMFKPRWGAFFQTSLDEHLRSLGVTSIVFAGCNFPNCPRTSIYEASERDYRVVLVTDAVSGIYERGRLELENIGVSLLSSRELTATLDRLSA